MNTRRRFVMAGVAIGAVLAMFRAAAQTGRRLPRVALVWSFSDAQATGTDPKDSDVGAFVAGLRELGLIDGRTIRLIRRSIEGRVDRTPAIMRELVAQGVDVIVTAGGPAVWAAHRATDRIAIVGVIDDVLDTGLIQSLARPGRNLTGIGESDPRLHGKRLQLLKEAVPAITRVGVVCYRQGPNDRGDWRGQLQETARALGVEIVWIAVDAPEDLGAAYARIVRERIDALYVTATHVNNSNAKAIAQFALDQRLPSFGFAEAGMLLDYWSNDVEAMRRAAAMVKKILDGANPGELPFEQPTKFDLILNLRTAKALGLSPPPSLRLRADRLIE